MVWVKRPGTKKNKISKARTVGITLEMYSVIFKTITHRMTTSSNGNIFCVIDPLWGESTGHRWVPFTKTSDAEFSCFLWSAPEQTVETTLKTPGGLEMPSRSLWRHCNSICWRHSTWHIHMHIYICKSYNHSDGYKRTATAPGTQIMTNVVNLTIPCGV